MLKDKVVLVTGGTGYIGAEICRMFSRYGASVVFTFHRNEAQAEKLLKEINGLKAIKADLRDVSGLTAGIDQLYREIPRIDVLVNNAAISQVMPFALLEEEDVDLVVDINIKGLLFMTKAVVKGMIRNRSGVVVNIGSIAGQRILEVPVTYAMTKSAITGFTYSLAAELKRFNIRVNSVIPGMLDGGVVKGIPENLKQEFLKHCLAGRPGTAEEVANLVCFLASDKSEYINGQNIAVDGGI